MLWTLGIDARPEAYGVLDAPQRFAAAPKGARGRSDVDSEEVEAADG